MTGITGFKKLIVHDLKHSVKLKALIIHDFKRPTI